MSVSTPPSTQKQRFLDSLRLCQLFTPDELKDWLDQYQDDEPTKIASAMIKAGMITQFQAKQLLAGRHRGFFLGSYQILDQLGQGGMGSVYVAKHTTLQRKVAIKVLHKDKSRDHKALERFFREARAAAALNHPNIVRLHDISQDSGVHFLVMEYVEGVTLAHLQETTGAMHYTQAVQYAAQVATGLQHAHKKGIVHRDIKPANLILEKGGVVKILDMGLARTFDNPQDDLTANFKGNSVLGTIDFISPEQAIKGKLDARSDIYSLGATLFSLITGHAPFSGTTAQKLMGHQLTEPPKLSKLRASVPPALNGVVARMLAKNPDERYQSCAEVIEALSPWLPADSFNAVVGSTQSSVGSDVLATPTERHRVSKTRLVKKSEKSFWRRYALHLSGAALGVLVAGALLMSAFSKASDTSKPLSLASSFSKIPVNNPAPSGNLPASPTAITETSKTIFQFEPSMLAAFNNEEEAASVLTSKWSGWATETVEPAAKASYMTKSFPDGLAIGVSVEGDKPGAQYAFRPHESNSGKKLKDGKRYRVHITSRTEGEASGVMSIQTINDKQVVASGSISPNTTSWQTLSIEFVKPQGKEVQFCVGPSKADGKSVWIRSVSIEAMDDETASVDPPAEVQKPAGSPVLPVSTLPAGTFFVLDLKKEKLFKMIKLGDDVIEGESGLPQWNPACEKGTKARFTLKDHGTGRVFGLERLEGNGYCVYVMNLQEVLKSVPPGTHLQIDLEYTTENSGKGEVKLLHGENYTTLISDKLENSDDKWTQVSLFYDHNSQQKPQLSFGAIRGSVYVKNLKIKIEGQ